MTDTIIVTHDSGRRFTATTEGYTAVAGKGDPDKGGQDGMSPGKLFAAALGMCVGVTLLAYCESHGRRCQGLTIEVVRENTEDGKRAKSVKLNVKVPYELSEKDGRVLERVAHRCYVTQSIIGGMQIDVVIASGEDTA